MTQFIPGMELSRAFYQDVVKPLVEAYFPGLSHAAGLIDYGSDVLGFDTAVSTDHQWGPRLSLFVGPADLMHSGGRLDDVLKSKLPAEFRGFSTHFSGTRSDRIRLMAPHSAGHVEHLIRIHTPDEFFLQHLGIDIHTEIKILEWLFFPQQRLANIRHGQIFHDGLNITPIKNALAYYPTDIWYYLMAVEWAKISAEEAFVGRCGDVHDEMGSRLVASRLVTRLMNLCFLQQRDYIPYSKWFGTAFHRLVKPAGLEDALAGALAATTWKEREHFLSIAYRHVGENHNRLAVTERVDTRIRNFHQRDYLVMDTGSFSDALHAAIKDPAVINLRRLGNIDQVTDSATILNDISVARQARHLYLYEDLGLDVSGAPPPAARQRPAKP